MKVIVAVLSLSLVLPLVGCRREASTPPVTRAATKRPATPAAVARIVFVDKEKACACTRTRIDNSWKALTDVVGYPPVPDVVRIHMDSQPEKAAPYQKQRPIMVPPAIYFLDRQDRLVQMLQGEVKSEQVRAALKRTVDRSE